MIDEKNQTQSMCAEAGHTQFGITLDLQERCAEILRWRKSGVLTGDALRSYAKGKHYAQEDDALQMAEADTAREAFAVIASLALHPETQPAQEASCTADIQQLKCELAAVTAERDQYRIEAERLAFLRRLLWRPTYACGEYRHEFSFWSKHEDFGVALDHHAAALAAKEDQ